MSGRAGLSRPKYICMRVLSLSVHTFNGRVLFVCLQVQNELSQKSEKLHLEVSLKQQLSEEYEQVSAQLQLWTFFFFFEFLTHHRAALSFD